MASQNLNDKTFALINNSENGEVSTETLFYYKQDEKGNVTAEYHGGSIVSGNIVGRFADDSTLDLLYHCITTGGELKSGKARVDVTSEPDDKIKLTLDWQWLTGDTSSGVSEYIEVESQINDRRPIASLHLRNPDRYHH